MNNEYEIIVDGVKHESTNYEDKAEYAFDNMDVLETETGERSYSSVFFTPLSSNLDIFDNLSDVRIESMPRVSHFLSELRLSIMRNLDNLKDIHFNKLSIEESTRPGELMIDWIYNYFRAFYSFDDEEGDMFGLIVNNTEAKQFKSEFLPLIETEYDEVVAKSISFITENLRR